VLISSLLHRLVDQGVRVAATSNTLPDRLGEGRFAADDFVREIQGLKEHFQILRIDGPDYRHRENLSPADALSWQEVAAAHLATASSTLDEAQVLQEHLSKIHPSSYGAMVAGVSRVFIQGLIPIAHQADALRWVVLIDRLYDRNVPVSFSGCALTEIFTPEMLKGGYRKKYLRAISRLSALSREV
ncbi:MAG: cell division protein ZapE, partial [Actinomycetales bacterium]|nr:cell division protein ZapE [Actinomycetales bacterium]